MTLCVHLTQIGRFLVMCGWPADAHVAAIVANLKAADVRISHDDGFVHILNAEGEEADIRAATSEITAALRGAIADHAFMAPEPVAERVP